MPLLCISGHNKPCPMPKNDFAKFENSCVIYLVYKGLVVLPFQKRSRSKPQTSVFRCISTISGSRSTMQRFQQNKKVFVVFQFLYSLNKVYQAFSNQGFKCSQICLWDDETFLDHVFINTFVCQFVIRFTLVFLVFETLKWLLLLYLVGLFLILQSASDTKIAVSNQKHLAITFLLFAAFLY